MGEVTVDMALKWLQVDLDSAFNNAHVLADLLNRGPGGRETSLCITKIEEAQHRLRDIKLQVDLEEILTHG